MSGSVRGAMEQSIVPTRLECVVDEAFEVGRHLVGLHFLRYRPRFRSEVHHRQALFEMRAQARMKKGPGGENFDRRSLR